MLLFLYEGGHGELQQFIDFHNCSALVVIPGCWVLFIGHTQHLRLWNPSSHNRPFPQHTNPAPRSCLRLNITSAEEVAGYHMGGIRASFSHLWSVCSGRWGYTPFSRWETDIPLRHVDSEGGCCAFGGGERFRSTRQAHLFPGWPCFAAVEEVKLVWISSYSDI